MPIANSAKSGKNYRMQPEAQNTVDNTGRNSLEW
jgi:hypothetical protein